MNGPASVASVRLDMRHITCGISYLATEENPNWIGSIGIAQICKDTYARSMRKVYRGFHCLCIRRIEREDAMTSRIARRG